MLAASIVDGARVIVWCGMFVVQPEGFQIRLVVFQYLLVVSVGQVDTDNFFVHRVQVVHAALEDGQRDGFVDSAGNDLSSVVTFDIRRFDLGLVDGTPVELLVGQIDGQRKWLANVGEEIANFRSIHVGL